jgi:hypothetical protein
VIVALPLLWACLTQNIIGRFLCDHDRGFDRVTADHVGHDRAPDNPAARLEVAFAVAVAFGLGLETPIDCWVADVLAVTDGDMNPRIVVSGPTCNSNTLLAGLALSWLTKTQPAELSPAIIKSYSVRSPSLS